MSYPGDQQQPGGWAPSRSPQSPYGPVDDQTGPGGSPYERPTSGSPYEGPHDDPHGGFGGAGPGGSFGAEQHGPYGGGPGGYESGGYDQGDYDQGRYDPPGGYEPDGFEQGGFDRGRYDPGDRGSRPGKDRKRTLIGATVVAGIVAIGGGTAFALASGGDKTGAAPATSAPPTPAPSPTPTATATGRGDRLQSRATDPRPLTLNEVFKDKSFKSGSRRYYMTGRRSERKCTPPTHGTKFRKVLTKGGCTQVLRATFSNGSLIGTIGVLNLRTETAAEAAKEESRDKDAFILALPGVGSTKKIGQGLSLTTAEADGHYLIMSWVQYPNGKQIAKKDYPAVTSFVQSTTYGSNLRTALNYRSMEGKPS